MWCRGRRRRRGRADALRENKLEGGFMGEMSEPRIRAPHTRRRALLRTASRATIAAGAVLAAIDSPVAAHDEEAHQSSAAGLSTLWIPPLAQCPTARS